MRQLTRATHIRFKIKPKLLLWSPFKHHQTEEEMTDLPPCPPDTLPLFSSVSIQLVTPCVVLYEGRTWFVLHVLPLQGRIRCNWCSQGNRGRRPLLVFGLRSYLLISASRILKCRADQISSLSWKEESDIKYAQAFLLCWQQIELSDDKRKQPLALLAPAWTALDTHNAVLVLTLSSPIHCSLFVQILNIWSVGSPPQFSCPLSPSPFC